MVAMVIGKHNRAPRKLKACDGMYRQRQEKLIYEMFKPGQEKDFDIGDIYPSGESRTELIYVQINKPKYLLFSSIVVCLSFSIDNLVRLTTSCDTFNCLHVYIHMFHDWKLVG